MEFWERKSLEKSLSIKNEELDDYNREIKSLTKDKEQVTSNAHLFRNSLLWSIPTSFIINVGICLFTQKVIGFTPGYIMSIPICYLTLNKILEVKLASIDDEIEEVKNSLLDKEDEIRKLTKKLTNVKQEEIVNNQVQVLPDNYEELYNKFFGNDYSNTNNNGKSRVLKR